MLIRSSEEDITLPVYSRLNEILINLPEPESLPTIKQAQVVRRFRSAKDKMLYYGILFKSDCKAGKNIIWNLRMKEGNS